MTNLHEKKLSKNNINNIIIHFLSTYTIKKYSYLTIITTSIRLRKKRKISPKSDLHLYFQINRHPTPSTELHLSFLFP